MHHIFKSSPVADLGEDPGGPPILGKKEEMTEERKAGSASKTISPPPEDSVFGNWVGHSLARLI